MNDNYLTIKDRILQLAKMKEDNKQIFFRRVGLNYSNFTGTNKKSDINSMSLAKIIEVYPDVNMCWLLTGKGEAFTGDYPLPNARRNNVSDFRGEYRTTVVDENNLSIMQMMIEERKSHDEIIGALQRTLEKQQDSINKLLDLLGNNS